MYTNLKKELAANMLSLRNASEAIGMSEQTFRDKMEKENFSITEAIKIKNFMLPKYDITYLFMSNMEIQNFETV